MVYEVDRGYRKARRRHVCDLCLGTIPIGQNHRYFTTAFDGTVDTCREHIGCVAIFDKAMAGDLFQEPDEEGALTGAVREWLKDQTASGTHTCHKFAVAIAAHVAWQRLGGPAKEHCA